ncbi:MAG: NADH-quinone oxidoreductase subunit NuoB [Planctomycetes bacterium]|nr:NADH-quinone oxidoreductase subunit NuoB [Planctomycetota bacterium]
MFDVIRERLRQGHRTAAYPAKPPAVADRFRGLPVIDDTKCEDGCRACIDACPTDALSNDGELKLDLGQCLFCVDCQQACPSGAMRYTTEYRLSTRTREDLVVSAKRKLELADALDAKTRRLFGRSLKLRQVSASGCNACEADVNVLNTLVFDLQRFGIQFVASPRHADGLLITGPVADNMKYALLQAYEAMPAPKVVIAVGACAISGGPYIGHQIVQQGCDRVVPVDLYVPGCPPSPWTILDGILRLLGRLEGTPAAAAPRQG